MRHNPYSADEHTCLFTHTFSYSPVPSPPPPPYSAESRSPNSFPQACWVATLGGCKLSLEYLQDTQRLRAEAGRTNTDRVGFLPSDELIKRNCLPIQGVPPK